MTTILGQHALSLPQGTTAQRPSSPTNGMVRFNTDLNYVEEYRQGQWQPLSNVFTAVGGVETTATVGGVNYKIHTFTSSGSFQVLSGTSQVDFLLVAGGGGSDSWANTNVVGGSGAGGLITSDDVGQISVIVGSYPIVVGAGGAGVIGEAVRGNNGVNSSVFNYAAVGGGRGSYSNGASGGSGGGGGSGTESASPSGDNPSSGGAGTSGQGNAGGSCNGTAGAGGGGGRGASGTSPGTTLTGGAGGSGRSISITGTSTFYAGGGGGTGRTASAGGAGGAGGGGAGGSQSVNPTPGTANTGGGGGGSKVTSTVPGSGGSGIVIIRYAI